MNLAGYTLAFLRAIWVFSGMVLYLSGYLVSSIWMPHTKDRALRLRRHYLKYWCIPALNIQVELIGSPSTQPALYVCNHRSFADPIVICKYVPAFVIAKAEVRSYPIINWGAELTGVIWVDRQDQISRTQARGTMVETIRQGYNVLVFPEGTVAVDPMPLPFKKGSFVEAAQNQIPVIPMAIEFRSKKDLWVIEKFIPQYMYQFSKWKTEVKMVIGKPITSIEGDLMHKDIFQWVGTQMAGMQKDWSTAFPS